MITKILELGILFLDAQCCFTAFCLRMLFVVYNEQVLLGSFIFTAFLYLLDSGSWQQAFSGNESIRLFPEFCAL